MAILKNLWLRGGSQKLAGAVLYTRKGETIARELAASVSNPRTTAQMSQRVKLANVVNFYRISAGWMRGAFENKTEKQTDYNAFVSANLTGSLVYLTKQQANVGAAVIAPYRIAQGTLNPINWTNVDTELPTSDLYIGNLDLSATTTVGELSQALMDKNALEAGMQLSLIQYIQQADDSGTPYAVCRAYEMIINPTSNQLVSAYIPTTILVKSAGANAALAVNTANFTGGFALLLSRTEGAAIKVTTASVILTSDNTYYASYTTDAAKQNAITSYGEGNDIFLSSAVAEQMGGSYATNANVLAVVINGQTILNGSQWPESITDGSSVYVRFSAPITPAAGDKFIFRQNLNVNTFTFPIASTAGVATTLVEYNHDGDVIVNRPTTNTRIITLEITAGGQQYTFTATQLPTDTGDGGSSGGGLS